MKKLAKAVGNAAKKAVGFAVDLYKRFPARCNTAIAGGVVFAAGLFGIVIPKETVLHDVAIVIPILIGGEVTHRKVSPAK